MDGYGEWQGSLRSSLYSEIMVLSQICLFEWAGLLCDKLYGLS